ncbi:MAG: hypothetical protein EPGJADBJ_00158 [Saprospiraceae bacterium]|nr:hypothetical protein [Saprospiraceae bacterium]
MNDCNPYGNECVKFADNRPLIALRDKRSKSGSEYRAKNESSKSIICLTVDGCLIESATEKKCDFLLLNCDGKIAHYIELKGGNMAQAIKQLTNSVLLTFQSLKEKQFEAAYAKLSLSKTPKVVPAREWLDLRRFMQKHKGDAYRQNTPFEDVI